MGARVTAVRRFARKLDPDAPEIPTPPDLPPGRIENVPGIAAASRALCAFDARAFGGSIDVPTVVVVSKEDRLIRARRQHELARAIRGAEMVEIDVAHNGWMVKPEEVAAGLVKAIGIVAAQLDDI